MRGYLPDVLVPWRDMWKRNNHVKAIDRMPPPAPLMAWAMLSDCCAAVEDAIVLEK